MLATAEEPQGPSPQKSDDQGTPAVIAVEEIRVDAPRLRSDTDVDIEAVRMAIDRHLVYPLKARRMGWTGRVVVAFELDERGVPGAVRVVSSSGFGSLDDAAVEAVRSETPFDAPGRRVGLAVSVAFRLGP